MGVMCHDETNFFWLGMSGLHPLHGGEHWEVQRVWLAGSTSSKWNASRRESDLLMSSVSIDSLFYGRVIPTY